MLDQRGRLLRAALGFAGCSMPSYDRALWALRTRLDSWAGIGHVAVGMHRQGYDLQLTQYDDRGWRCGVGGDQARTRNSGARALKDPLSLPPFGTRPGVRLGTR